MSVVRVDGNRGADGLIISARRMLSNAPEGVLAWNGRLPLKCDGTHGLLHNKWKLIAVTTLQMELLQRALSHMVSKNFQQSVGDSRNALICCLKLSQFMV